MYSGNVGMKKSRLFFTNKIVRCIKTRAMCV